MENFNGLGSFLAAECQMLGLAAEVLAAHFLDEQFSPVDVLRALRERKKCLLDYSQFKNQQNVQLCVVAGYAAQKLQLPVSMRSLNYREPSGDEVQFLLRDNVCDHLSIFKINSQPNAGDQKVSDAFDRISDELALVLKPFFDVLTSIASCIANSSGIASPEYLAANTAECLETNSSPKDILSLRTHLSLILERLSEITTSKT